MSWRELWLMALMATGSHGCLKCSQEGAAIVKDFRDNYLYYKFRRDSGLRKKLQKFMDDEIEDIPQYFLNKEKFKGVIDEFSLDTLVTHFKRSLNQIKENEFEGEQLFNEVVWSVQNLKATFEKMLPAFQKSSDPCPEKSIPSPMGFLLPTTTLQVYCSNDCGHMIYVLYSCFSCQMNYYSCSKNVNCGDRNIEVEMDDDLILDCGLTWHKASHGVKTYSFFRLLGNTEKLMTTGLDSFLVKKMANMNDTGRYRCKMMGAEGYLSSQLDYRVKVVPAFGRTTWFPRPGKTTLDGPLTLGVSSRAPLPKEDWTGLIVIGVSGGLLLIFTGGFIWFYIRKNKKEEEEEQEEEEEEEEYATETETKSELVEM